jgi:nicotinamide-nucleotide amidase
MRHAAAVLTVGDELLKGCTLNTNARFIGECLSELGFRVVAQASCPDDKKMIAARLAEALGAAELVIVTGGLGPTPDDVTREAIADFFRVPLALSKVQHARILRYFRARRKRMPAIVRREACFPVNADPLVNRHGIALGFSIDCGRRLIVVLPGVPSEMEKMFRELVVPLLRLKFPGARPAAQLTAKIAGLSEPDIMRKLGRDFFDEPFDFGIYPAPSETTIRIQTATRPARERVRRRLKARLGASVFALEDISLARAVGARLRARRATLAAAESCTGGLFAAEITQVPGASRYFKGGITAYSDRVKAEALDVDPAMLRLKGAVSRQTALALARGVRRKLRATYGVGITGIAGPSGGSARKPVGTVFIAVAGPEGASAREFHFWGDRGQIREKAAKKALDLLWRRLA